MNALELRIILKYMHNQRFRMLYRVAVKLAKKEITDC